MVSSTSKLLRLLLTSVIGVGLVVVWPAVAAAAQNQEPPEVKSEETAPTFTVRAQRNEVLVRVIVRDANGNVVGGLTKDDFRLFDNRKPQSVTAFSVENNQLAPAGKPPTPAAATAKSAQSAEPAEAEPVLALPQRYVAFYFDDLVVSFEDMVRIREAAGKFIESSLQPTDRAGIFTSSGLGVLDFTADRANLRKTLANLRPRPRNVPPELDCPPLTPYEAYLIDEQHDPIMLNIAGLEYIACACGGDPKSCADPQARAQDAARLAWQYDQVQARQSLRVLLDLVRRMGSLPGQRSVLWLSQGFLTFDLHSDLNELTDRALREHVVINALDSRGLWVNVPGGEASENNVLPFESAGPAMSASQTMYREMGRSMNQDVMAQVSHDTGGVFVRNTNDYDGGFRKAGALPEFSYLLAFSPQNLKYDGKFHKLKVELANARGLSVQARNGYFARNEALHPEERARQEIEDAVFSREEYREFPVDLQTQFFKLSNAEARLSVMARVDAHAMHFRKEGDRNLVSLKMVCAAFDRDGNLAAGTQRNVDLSLRDATLAHLLSAGLNIRGQLKLSAGTYALRVVVYQIDSAQVTALNRTVEIPF
ncbi:MAG: VWA domain-containing protein [Terriglobia bacterium]|jgi:VWFA-related protein